MYINITSCWYNIHALGTGWDNTIIGMLVFVNYEGRSHLCTIENFGIKKQLGYLCKVIVLEKRKTISAFIGIFSVPNLIFSSEDGLLFSKVSPKF
jgi:hypothetical protein